MPSPDRVKILNNFIKNVKKQLQGIQSKAEETKMSQIKGEQHFMHLNKTINFICEFERDSAEKDKTIHELHKNVKAMSATIESLKGNLNRHFVLGFFMGKCNFLFFSNHF